MQTFTPIPDELLAYATPAELAQYEQALKVELAMQSPLDYACYVSPETVRYAHSELLNRVLVDLVNGKLIHPKTGLVTYKLAISMPPQHGKSYLVSDHFPAWFRNLYPEKNIAVVGYEANFAKSWGSKAQAHIVEHPELGYKIDYKHSAADDWAFVGHKGQMFTSGTGGALTGKGVHALVIDDPIKNAQEAASPTVRNTAYNWFLSTAYTRRRDERTPVIIMNTRWHEDDLMGRMLDDEPDEWYVLNLPAIAMEDDPLGREVGEALCPDKYSIEYLRAVSKTQGAMWFSAMYQGMPTIEGGGLFRRELFRYWGHTDGGLNYALQDKGGNLEYVPVKECTRFQTVDLAVTKKTSADFSVISTWDVTKDRRLILVARERKRMEAPEHLNFVQTAFSKMKAKWVGTEPVTYGLSLIQMLQTDSVFGAHIPVRKIPADADKYTKAVPAGALMETGRVYFPRHAEWLTEWEHELLQFPNGAHDDQVDTLSMAVYEVTKGSLRSALRNRRTEPVTMQERVDAHYEASISKRRRSLRHKSTNPDLGRF